MRTLLATLLVAPALALAQVPLRPPPRDPNQPPRPAPAPAPGVSPPSAPGAPAAPRPSVSPPPAPGTVPAAPRPNASPAPGQPPATPGQPPGAAPRPNATRATEPLRTTDSKCVPLQGRFMLTFNKAEIVDILEQASRWTCRNFVYTEDVARGKITLLSKTPVTADEAYAAFLAALNSNNIAVYPTGRYYKLIRTADSKKNPIPTYTGSGDTPANEQPVTKVIRLQNADADQMRGIIGNFVSPQGADVQAIPPDMLIVTDIGLNIRRLERIMDAVDRPGGGELVRIVQIRYAAAKDVADKLNQIFQAQGGAKAGRRTLIAPSGARPPPAAPGQPAPSPAIAQGVPAAERPTDVSVSKILPDERTNKLIIIADEKSFQRILELIDQLDVPTSGEGGIHVVFLKNANAEELATTLSNLAQGQSKRTPGALGAAVPTLPGQPPAPRPATPAGADVSAELLSGEVKITSDKAQNALLIQASGADFNAISRLIDKLDRPRRQVFVEAVIMEVNLRNSTDFGVGMHTATTADYKGETGLIPIVSQPGRVSSFDLLSTVGLGGFITGFTGPVTAELKNLGFNIPSIGVLVQALQSNADANILSTPHLVATDNEESEITVGQNVPFQAGYAPSGLSSLVTGTTATASTLGSVLGSQGLSGLYAPIQRQPVELRLKIKPQINEGGNVRLTIDEQIEEITDKDPQLGPTTSKRTVKTQVVARDQSTIVIGGLIQERFVRSAKKIPILGSLPILGWLFRDTSTIKQKTNLLLFLTPYIIRDESDYRRIYEKKRKEQQDFIEQFYGRQPAYVVPIDFTRKAGPFARMHAGVAEETSKVENGGAGAPGERVIVPGGAPPAPGAGTPLPRSPGDAGTLEDGTPVDRLDVQPEVPGLPPEAPPQPPVVPPTTPPPAAQPPAEPPPGAAPPAPQGTQPPG
ncbi:MAG TPA: type II secretion system secretin GspD [Anaeromyxobacter sp.]|nr:type II secretion system secretin GspD [Anaeromyxobacter sp.]